MPKQKAHKGLKKRVKVTATKKLVYKKPGLGHLNSGKPGQRKQNLRRPGQITGAFVDRALEKLCEL